ncbi:MAG: hypothetical protein U1G07_02540 [Verrucomicrobiota bacterium]
MKWTLLKRGPALLLLINALAGSWPALAQDGEGPRVPRALEPRLKEFIGQKEALARRLAEREGKEQHPDVWRFFNAAKVGDWPTLVEAYHVLRSGAYQYLGGDKDERLMTTVWQAVNESFGAYDEIAQGDEFYVTYFGEEIIKSMPAGSIYFGGTDPGRWLVTAFCKSHNDGDPCFVLTQNALADSLYLQYLRELFGKKINLPTAQDSEKAFSFYIQEAKKRLDADKLLPGENVYEDDNGKVQVSGQVAVMNINGLLAKAIFDANPDRLCFIEESFPLEWMKPHLAPHGLIMKLERKPIIELPVAVVDKDRAYWTQITDRAVGNWLKRETSVKEVCAFAARVFESHDQTGFKGDARFLKNAPAQKTYSKLRSGIGSVYAWRSRNSTSAREKERLAQEADFAFRQAFALCPYSPEAVLGYAQLLVEQKRNKEALLLAETAENVSPGNGSINSLVWKLQEKEQKASEERPSP